VKQHSKAVVGKALKAPPSTFDPLDTEVLSLRRPVRSAGAVVVQDLFSPAREGVTERDDFGDLVVEAADDGLV
jgi:hypothetical protein